MRVWGNTSHGGFHFACLSGRLEVEDHPLPWPKRRSFLLGSQSSLTEAFYSDMELTLSSKAPWSVEVTQLR